MSDATICGKDVMVLQQFRTTLSAQVGLLAEGSFKNTAVYQAVAARLEKDDFSWGDAHFVEQSIAPYHSDGRILIEIERLLVQARVIMDRETSGFYAEVDPKPMTSDCRRDLLSRILVDLQLESQKRERRKWLLERTCKRLVYLMLAGFGVLLLHAEVIALARTVFWFLIGLLGGLLPGGGGGVALPWCGPGIGQVMLLALTGGCLGALVTVAIRMNNYFKSSRLREVESFSSHAYLLNRMLIGAVGALAGCYLVNAQIISLFNISNLFAPLPKGADPCGGAGTVYSIDVLKTVVVGIAFGCSEYFIPATFGKLPTPKADAGGGTATAAGGAVSTRPVAPAPRPHPAQPVRSGKAAGADRDAAPVEASAPVPAHASDPLELLDRLNLDERLEDDAPGQADVSGQADAPGQANAQGKGGAAARPGKGDAGSGGGAGGEGA